MLQCEICLKMFSSRSGKYQHKKAKTKCSPPTDDSNFKKEEFTSNGENFLRNDFDLMEKTIKKGCHDVAGGVVDMVKIMYFGSKLST